MDTNTLAILATASRSNKAKELGIDNTVPENLRLNVYCVWWRIETLMPFIDKITSWYRCPKLNDAVGGAATSDHKKALGVDIRPNIDKHDFVKLIYQAVWPIKQVIVYENSRHVHLAFWPQIEGVSSKYWLFKTGKDYERYKWK